MLDEDEILDLGEDVRIPEDQSFGDPHPMAITDGTPQRDRVAGANAVPGFDKAEAEKALVASMQGSGLAAVQQSPFRVALFVTVGKEKVRSIGVMMLVLRTMKVPGEAGSREVAVWGQQRTSSASDAEAAAQMKGLLDELCKEFVAMAGLSSAAPAQPPAAPAPAPTPSPAPAPASAPAPAPENAPKP